MKLFTKPDLTVRWILEGVKLGCIKNTGGDLDIKLVNLQGLIYPLYREQGVSINSQRYFLIKVKQHINTLHNVTHFHFSC